MAEGKEVAVVEAPQRSALLRPVAPVAQILEAQNEAREVISKALTKGRDYGVVPGTGGKATLFKPGAERVNRAFGATATFEIVEQEVDHSRRIEWAKEKWTGAKGSRRKTLTEGVSFGLYRYVVKCTLVQLETGIPLGEGMGVCSTVESKYIDRPRELENTVLKIAKKRAYVDATLVAYGLSDQFTQDVEDMAGDPEEAEPEPDPEKEWATASQLGELRSLLESDAFSTRMRLAATGEIEAGISQATADIRIAEAKAVIAKHVAKAPAAVRADYDDNNDADGELGF